MPEDAARKGSVQNLRIPPYTNPTTQWADAKVWWFMVLAQARVHIHVVGKDWHQGPTGQAQMVGERELLKPRCEEHLEGPVA